MVPGLGPLPLQVLLIVQFDANARVLLHDLTIYTLCRACRCHGRGSARNKGCDVRAPGQTRWGMPILRG